MSKKSPTKSSQRKRPKISVYERFIRQETPSFHAFFIEEPKLVFANGNLAVDPKVGLGNYGPFELSATGNKTIRIGIIGTGEGIQAFLNYLRKAQSRISAGFNRKGKPYDSLGFPDFPGCSPDESFRASFVSDSTIHRVIKEDSFQEATSELTDQGKIRAVVTLLDKELSALSDREPAPDVVILVMPAIVEKECGNVGLAFAGPKLKLTPTQRFQRKLEKQSARTGQTLLPINFDTVEEEQSALNKGFYNLHHALKAHAMKYRLPTQIVWESTLKGESGNQDPASVAWNIFTALFYKAGSIPWKLQTLPDDTCFVGVSFYKETPHADADVQTSLAQVFGAGEGMVLKGERAFVDKKRDRKPHLDERGAESLLQKAITLYTDQHRVRPKRVVIHKTSRYWPEELRGFKKGLADIYLYDFLTLETLGMRFMRMGKEPPLRGTVIQLGAKNYLVYCVGYVPYLRTYPGMTIPHPLEIVEHHGDSPATTVCREILALTKVNWNSCFFGSGVPITIRFARSVGKILAELPQGVQPETKYKFYM